MSLRLVYFIQKLFTLVILDQEKVVFVIFFFCTQNVVRRRSRYTIFALLKLKNSPVVEKPTQSKHRWNVAAFRAAFCAAFWQLPKKVVENTSEKNISIIKRNYITFFTCKNPQIYGVVFATCKQQKYIRERDETLTRERWC